MTFDQITKEIKAKSYRPIYLLHGEESYFIDAISDLIEKSVLNDGEKAFNQSVLYGKDIGFKDIVDEASQFPMMASHRVVIVKEAQSMRSIKDLAKYAESPSPTSIVVINHKHKKFDSRTKLAKAVKANGVLFESKKLYDNQVPQWISSYLSKKKVVIKPEAATLAAEFMGSDLSKVSNELDKISLNVKENEPIDIPKIQELVGMSKDYNVFELQKAIGQRNTEKAFRIVNYFDANPKANPLVVVISNLLGFFQKVYTAAYYGKKNDNELKVLLGLPTAYFVRDYRQAAQNFRGAKLISIFEALKEADLKSKGMGARNLSPKEILTDFLIDVFYK